MGSLVASVVYGCAVAALETLLVVLPLLFVPSADDDFAQKDAQLLAVDAQRVEM